MFANHNSHGYVSAFVRVKVVDLHGNKRCRRVQVGRDYNISLEAAQTMVDTARKANSSLEVCAEFKVAI